MDLELTMYFSKLTKSWRN